MDATPNDPDPIFRQRLALRRLPLWLILLLGVGVIWYALLRANPLWADINQARFVQVSLNSDRLAAYGPDDVQEAGQVDLTILFDILRDQNPRKDPKAPFATLAASLNTPVPSATLRPGETPFPTPTAGSTQPTQTPTSPGLLPTVPPVNTLVPVLPTSGPLPTLPPILPTSLPKVLPTLQSILPTSLPKVLPTLQSILP